MIRRLTVITALALVLALPIAANAQGVAGSSPDGSRAADPIGSIIGGVIGGVVGGLLGIDERPRFRAYVETRHLPSDATRDELRVGAFMPEAGVTYYDVPPEYSAHDARYAVVNGRIVLVDARTRRIVEIID